MSAGAKAATAAGAAAAGTAEAARAEVAAAGRKVVSLVGPTAVGKSAVALDLASDFNGEIVSLDSRQMVRQLDIGTAKPTCDDRQRVKHHLIDITEPDEPLSLAEVQTLAYAAIDGILDRGRRPFLVGGTGQYVRAVLEGWVIPAVPPDPTLRKHLEALAAETGAATLHARLAAIDARAAARIDARNVRRVVRALEVFEHTGERISDLQDRTAPPYDVLAIGLTRPRPELFARIDRRIDAMLVAGLEREVRRLVAAGYGFDLPALSSVGYAEWRTYLAGGVDRGEVVRLIRHNTRRLVRQQATWFRQDDPELTWFDLARTSYGDVRVLVAEFLGAGKR